MRINRIELFNIGSYEGLNEFDIKSQGLDGNIIVVGGKNGAGKTTLFTAIKLCLYGYKESGYQSMNAFYKREIKKIINDKAKAENNAYAYVLLDLDILNGQDWDRFILKREWSLENPSFEAITVEKNNHILDEEEKVDFDNFLMNLLPPELFELYFFDGEQIADFFLEDNNNERIKKAFLTICGYDTFEIIYKNFLRVSKQNADDDDPTLAYFKAEDELHTIEVKLHSCQKDVQIVSEEIEAEDSKLKALETAYKSAGGVATDEWNQKHLELKNEERIREEKNAWVKNAVNDIIPYIILNRELNALLERMSLEQESERINLLRESITALLPNVLKNVTERHPELSKEAGNEILEELLSNISESTVTNILNLSKTEYQKLVGTVMTLISIDKDEIITARKEIKKSITRSQKIRAELDKLSTEGAENYLSDKEKSINLKLELINKRELLLQQISEIKEELDRANAVYNKAAKDLEKHFKSQSVTALTGKAIVFLESLQKKLYDSEVSKIKSLFMAKMRQLVRKEQFIDRIEIDDDFNVHVYKSVELDIIGIQNKLKSIGAEAYSLEYGDIHCKDLLQKTGHDSLSEFAKATIQEVSNIDVLMEFDKSTMSKGEKQVFIMALYWSIMQLCKKDVPFIIDTPFARIDTEHRAHITEHFFKELKGQVFIFSTDEEITQEHIAVIGNNLGGKFLIENVTNTNTSIITGKYFGE